MSVGLHSDVENMCLSCCGGTSLIYMAILYKWNSFSSFYSLRTSVQKYHVAAWVVTHSPSTLSISSTQSQRSFSPINPYGESIYNWCCTRSNSSMSGITVRTPDMAVSHMINGLALLTDPGWAECVSVCVLHVRDVRCPLGGRDRLGGCWCVPVWWVRSRGVRGELKQRDGLHLSAWPTLKWPSLRID